MWNINRISESITIKAVAYDILLSPSSEWTGVSWGIGSGPISLGLTLNENLSSRLKSDSSKLMRLWRFAAELRSDNCRATVQRRVLNFCCFTETSRKRRLTVRRNSRDHPTTVTWRFTAEFSDIFKYLALLLKRRHYFVVLVRRRLRVCHTNEQ